MSNSIGIPKRRKAEPRLRDIHAEGTRTAVLDAATKHFVSKGFVETSLDDVAVTALTTKGAIYHHFLDKRDLFRAVYESLAREMVEAIATSSIQHGGEAEGAIRAFLTQGKSERYRQVLFQDGMAVLGGIECRAIDAKYGLGLLTALVRTSVEPALLKKTGNDIVAKLMLALVIEAGQIIGTSDDADGTLRSAELILTRMFAALRPSKNPS